ncbi:MAG: flagellar biosynthesis anti-sigma factor FlgM [Desulfonatronovibrio sp.]
MQIKGLLTGLQTYEQSRIDKARDKSAQTGSRGAASSDKVTLSQGARLYKAGMEEAINSDEVRAEKVNELKAQIQNGTYKPDSRRIAEKMISQDLESWF